MNRQSRISTPPAGVHLTSVICITASAGPLSHVSQGSSSLRVNPAGVLFIAPAGDILSLSRRGLEATPRKSENTAREPVRSSQTSPDTVGLIANYARGFMRRQTDVAGGGFDSRRDRDSVVSAVHRFVLRVGGGPVSSVLPDGRGIYPCANVRERSRAPGLLGKAGSVPAGRRFDSARSMYSVAVPHRRLAVLGSARPPLRRAGAPGPRR